MKGFLGGTPKTQNHSRSPINRIKLPAQEEAASVLHAPEAGDGHRRKSYWSGSSSEGSFHTPMRFSNVPRSTAPSSNSKALARSRRAWCGGHVCVWVWEGEAGHEVLPSSPRWRRAFLDKVHPGSHLQLRHELPLVLEGFGGLCSLGSWRQNGLAMRLPIGRCTVA